jgi:hypothetical protein
VADLARASSARVLALEPLSEREAEELLVGLLAGVPGEERMVPAVVRRAGGVPRFLVSYAEDLRARGDGI